MDKCARRYDFASTFLLLRARIIKLDKSSYSTRVGEKAITALVNILSSERHPCHNLSRFQLTQGAFAIARTQPTKKVFLFFKRQISSAGTELLRGTLNRHSKRQSTNLLNHYISNGSGVRARLMNCGV